MTICGRITICVIGLVDMLTLACSHPAHAQLCEACVQCSLTAAMIMSGPQPDCINYAYVQEIVKFEGSQSIQYTVATLYIYMCVCVCVCVCVYIYIYVCVCVCVCVCVYIYIYIYIYM